MTRLLCPICGTGNCGDWGHCASAPDDPDNWRDEAEDKESMDNERDDHGCVPVVDPSYGYRFGDFMGE